MQISQGGHVVVLASNTGKMALLDDDERTDALGHSKRTPATSAVDDLVQLHADLDGRVVAAIGCEAVTLEDI